MDYDSGLPVFLPRILWLAMSRSLLLAVAVCHGCAPEIAPPVSPAAFAVPQVVAGSGDPSPAFVDQVRAVVVEQHAELVSFFGLAAPERYFVFVHADRSHLPAEIARHLHEDSPAFALLGRHQVHLVHGEMVRLGTSLRGVVTHELVHELLDQFAEPHGRLLPRWFHEGLAQHIAGDTYLGAREEDLVWRVAAGRLPGFGDLAAGFPDEREAIRLAYAQSYSYVSFLVRECGVTRLLRAVRNVDERTSFDRALVGATMRSPLDLQDAWREHVLHRSGAPWRVFLEQWFGLLGVALLPVLVLALRRRLAAGQLAARHLESSAGAATAARLEAAANAPPPPDPEDEDADAALDDPTDAAESAADETRPEGRANGPGW